MNARDIILDSISARPHRNVPEPPVYKAPAVSDAVAAFSQRAKTAIADVQILERSEDVPRVVAELLRARNMAARLHLPVQSELGDFAWQPAVDIDYTPPGPDDAALALAAAGIAETGTLVYASTVDSPASWHFRPGFEIAVLYASDIVAHLEDVLAQVKAAGAMPSTLNLVTGPSRTADIEQTLELGAHGPKELAILIIRD
ncbi:MAG TPA: LUD domain-containing protein [Rhizomicrobium sp.]|nr:LUD domain-containing protein [Rhizomicrobium sp.]